MGFCFSNKKIKGNWQFSGTLAVSGTVAALRY